MQLDRLPPHDIIAEQSVIGSILIDGNSITKVKAHNFEDAEIFLNQLRDVLIQHRKTDNKVSHFRAKKIARKAFQVLPEQLQMPIRRVVQKARTSRFEKQNTI